MAKILCFSHSVNPDEDMEPQPEKGPQDKAVE